MEDDNQDMHSCRMDFSYLVLSLFPMAHCHSCVLLMYIRVHMRCMCVLRVHISVMSINNSQAAGRGDDHKVAATSVGKIQVDEIYNCGSSSLQIKQ